MGRLRFRSEGVTTKGKNPFYPAIVERERMKLRCFQKSHQMVPDKDEDSEFATGFLGDTFERNSRFAFSHRTFQDLVEESKTNGGTGGATWGRIEVFPVGFLDAGYRLDICSET